jgi:hypothetical protein
MESPEEVKTAEKAQSPPVQETGRPLRRTGLNWTEDELSRWERKIVEEAMQEHDTASPKHLAMEKIDRLPRPLRQLLCHRFERAKWRQLE